MRWISTDSVVLHRTQKKPEFLDFEEIPAFFGRRWID